MYVVTEIDEKWYAKVDHFYVLFYVLLSQSEINLTNFMIITTG